MKKMKGVAAAVVVGSSPSPYAVAAAAGAGYDDPRIRFKHESLMQDYEELLKETEAKRKRLEMMKQRKMTLMAEVRFLRRRFKYLTENQTQNLKPEQKLLPSQTTVINKSKKVRKNKGTNSSNHETPASSRQPAPKFDLNRKGRVYTEKDSVAARVSAAPSIDLNQKQQNSSHMGREAAMRNSGVIPDLNEKERMLGGKDAATRNNAPFFDLNQISTEEEELQTNGEMMTTTRIEEPRIISTLRGGIIDEQHSNDLKLSACRNIGNVPSRAGKRKISWQDPVALRV
ncbi:unnamed protein product [Linum tenue]|uniref:Uncharacterized protein n=1 Tax=Linum tenue TaxID=586396 RepID=A0AAV0ICF6_9ROSI|nr:unnamed protein product [Linum tenue]